jgi:hypothetical protein
MSTQNNNKSTQIFVIIMGLLTGFSGISHGIFETIQGNKPATDILERIGAFTIIPNYLFTGITSIIISSAIGVWTVEFIHKKHGPAIYLLLSIILCLTGGGIAMIPGFLLTWAVATRINKPLTWWKKGLQKNLRQQLSKAWLTVLITGFLFISTGIAIWLLLTPPGETYKITFVDYACWLFLCIGLLLLIITIISGFARDIEIEILKEELLSNGKEFVSEAKNGNTKPLSNLINS